MLLAQLTTPKQLAWPTLQAHKVTQLRKRFWITSDIPDPEEYFIRARPKSENNFHFIINGEEFDNFFSSGLSFTKIGPFEKED